MADTTPTGSINVTLTTAKQSFLKEKSAYAFTVAFDGSKAHWSTIYDASTDTASSTATIPLINSGKLYVVQTNADLKQIQAQITKESDLTPLNATTATYGFRYDSFEYALDAADQGGTPQGNLTSVNGFGFPMSLQVDYTNGAKSMTSGYAVSGDTLTSDLSAAGSPLINFSSGGLDGEFLYAGSPSTPSQGGYTRPVQFTDAHWDTYLSDLGAQLKDHPVRVAGVFNGSPDASGEWHNQAFYSYIVSYDASTSTFILTPEDNSQVKGTIKISSGDLAKNIYAIDASTKADIYSVENGVETLYSSEFLGANDQYGAIFTQFLTGLDLGYFGQTGASQATGADGVNLNFNWNWSPTYAFGNNLKTGTIKPTYDSYSEVFFNHSNSYGSQYSDNAMSQYPVGGPLLNLFETVNGVNQNVSADQITLTIFDDSETPTGYVQPVLYDYIAPPSKGSYGTFADMSEATYGNMVLNLGIPAGTPGGSPDVPADRLAQTSWFADPSKFAFSYQYLVSEDTWSTPSFVYSDEGKDSQLWSQWSLDSSGGRASMTAGTTAGQQGTGSMLLNNIPLSKTEGVVNWHRLNVYDKTVSNWESQDPVKTFNMFTTADGSGGFYYKDGKLAIDGGAQFTSMTQDSGPSATLNLTVGSGAFFDPSLMFAHPKTGQQYAMSGTLPAAPVAGSIDTAKGFVAADGQSSMTSPSASVKSNNVAFAWTGLNPASKTGTDPWISNYTNKASAQHTVTVSWSLFTSKDQGSAGSIKTTADIDGEWLTAKAPIAPGKYTVTMTEYMSVNGSDVQFAQSSSPLTLTVQSSDTVQGMRDAYLVDSPSSLVVGKSGGVLANDLGSPISASLASGPSNGSVSLNPDGSFTYTPDAGFVGMDSFEYFSEFDLGGGQVEKSIATVNLQVIPEIGKLAGALNDYSMVGLGAYGYFHHGVGQSEADSYLSMLDQYQAQGMSDEQAFYNLANALGESDRARSLYPFLENPTTNEADINAFLDTVYQVLFNRAPDDVGRAYWVDDIQKAIERGDDIDPYVYTIMNGAQEADMKVLTAKSMIAKEQLFQQYQQDSTITNQDSGEFLASADPVNLSNSMTSVYNDAII